MYHPHTGCSTVWRTSSGLQHSVFSLVSISCNWCWSSCRNLCPRDSFVTQLPSVPFYLLPSSSSSSSFSSSSSSPSSSSSSPSSSPSSSSSSSSFSSLSSCFLSLSVYHSPTLTYGLRLRLVCVYFLYRRNLVQRKVPRFSQGSHGGG